MTAARSFAPAMNLKVLPLQDEWAMRRMNLISRSEPAAGSPLAQLMQHLERCAQ
jgi:hypothetical protein